MIPVFLATLAYQWSFSRTRGDDPILDTGIELAFMFIFPAYAGVILVKTGRISQGMSFSRIRGGDPRRVVDELKNELFFPHTRG